MDYGDKGIGPAHGQVVLWSINNSDKLKTINMSNTIEDILLDAHHHNKREELLTYLETIRIKNPNRELTDLYQMAYERVMRP